MIILLNESKQLKYELKKNLLYADEFVNNKKTAVLTLYILF